MKSLGRISNSLEDVGMELMVDRFRCLFRGVLEEKREDARGMEDLESESLPVLLTMARQNYAFSNRDKSTKWTVVDEMKLDSMRCG